MIHVYNSLLIPEMAAAVEKDVDGIKWRSRWHSTKNKVDNPNDQWHWHHSFFQDTKSMPAPDKETLLKLDIQYPNIMYLWKMIQKGIKQSTGYKCDFTRAYANAHTYGVDGLVHTDDGDYTAIFYPCSNWNIMWDGGTAFYNDSKTDIMHYNGYVHNRAIVFPASMQHRAMPVTKTCFRLRSVIVFKCVIDVNDSSYAEQYYKDGKGAMETLTNTGT
jgi:SM-20-related protein